MKTERWRQRDEDIERWRQIHGDIEKWRHREMETYIDGYMER